MNSDTTQSQARCAQPACSPASFIAEVLRKDEAAVDELKTHIDDWLDEPATNETEKLVKEWLEHYRRPAIDKDHKWLSARVLLCDYEGKRYRCIGCSRMGDVWLTTNFEAEYGYEKRIDVTGCSNWEVRQNVTGELTPARKTATTQPIESNE